MAFRRTLTLTRFFNIPNSSSTIRSKVPPPRCSSSSSAAASTSLLPKSLLLNHLPTPQVDAIPPERFSFPAGGDISDRFRTGVNPGHIRLDQLHPPSGKAVTAAQARKVLRAAQMEAVREWLRGVRQSCVSYAEFVDICGEVPGVESAAATARALEESGTVLVFGDVVFLRPELVARAIEDMIPREHSKELKELEEKKASIDAEAEAAVKREMWCGLGLLALQTAGFMRLTFWELSWDVMEPICFYVTTAYFMGGYAFFLRTAKDPSFEGFFHARFAAKQRRLMTTHKFDEDRFNELRRRHTVTLPTANHSSSSSHPFSHGCDYCHQEP